MTMWAAIQRIAHGAYQTFTGVPPLNWGGIIGGIGAGLAVVLGAKAAFMFNWLMLAMGTDLLSGLFRAIRRPDEHVSALVFASGFLGKLMRILLIVPAVLTEQVIKVMGFPLPAHALPLLAVCGLIMFESGSIVQNVQASEGNILPVRVMRVLVDFWGKKVEEEAPKP